MTISQPTVVTHDTDAACEPSIVGPKAARLSELRTAGFSVPDGVVLPASLLCLWTAGDGPPSEVTHAVEEVVALLGDGPLAVRSSADTEDGDAASFAGAYATVLGAIGVEQVTAAVRTCLDSTDAQRVSASERGAGVRMAVLCQPLLAPDAAGVAFTADPVTGDTDVVRVSAVRGLGDRLVDGSAIADEWRIVGSSAERIPSAGEDALTAEDAELVAEVARRAADHFGAPQDVEWALQGGQVHVLQSRPITALPVRPAAELSGLGWEKDVSHYPELVTPFGWSLFGPSADAAVRAMATDFGLMLAGLDQVSIGGEVYVRPVPPFGSTEPQGKVPPALAVGVVARVVPVMRRRMATAKRALTTGLPERQLARWDEEWRPEFQRRTQDLLAEDLTGIGDGELVHHLDRARVLLDDGHYVHFQLVIPYSLALFDLVTACEELLGWDEHQSLRLLVGCSPASVAGARALDDLRARVASTPALTAALQASPADPVAALRTIDPAVADELGAWLHQHAWRPVNYDPGSPAVIERPGVITRLLLQSDERIDADVASRAEADALARLEGTDRERFTAALAGARRAYPVREDNVTLTDNIPCGILRRWVLEAGRRLVGRGRLEQVDDAVFCTADELAAVLRTDDLVDLASLVARRRGELAWVRSHPGPLLVGTPDDMPDLRHLPKHGRHMNEALLWALKMEFPGHSDDGPEPDAATAITGTPASPGTFTGPVRVVRSEADFGAVLPGEVLVCPTASPAWTFLFALAGAVVADGGGPLAHAAIVAREHGLPAVLGTGDATRKLTDGQLVTVDGTSGTVTSA